jgi:hypothetical protein
MLAVGSLLATGVLDWRADCLRGCPQAFDTLFWFGGALCGYFGLFSWSVG